MKNTKEEIAALTAVVVLFVGMPICGFCWMYVINTWLLFFGKTATISFWVCCLLGIIPCFGQTALPAAALTYILMLFLK